MRMQSSSGRMKILPSPMRPSGPVRPASMMAFTVGSTKSSFTAICSWTLCRRFTVSSWPVNLGVPLLPAEAAGVDDGEAEHLDLVERLLDGLDLRRLDDGEDELHGCLQPSC